MWYVDPYSGYHIIRVVAATEHVSHKQRPKHDDNSQKTSEAEAAAAASAVAVAVKAPSPQTNERRMPKETGGNGYTKQVKKKHLLLKFTTRHRGHCRADFLL